MIVTQIVVPDIQQSRIAPHNCIPNITNAVQLALSSLHTGGWQRITGAGSRRMVVYVCLQIGFLSRMLLTPNGIVLLQMLFVILVTTCRDQSQLIKKKYIYI